MSEIITQLASTMMKTGWKDLGTFFTASSLIII
jgi:hypothetical protein